MGWSLHTRCRAIAGRTARCDATVNFDTYRILQRHHAVSLPQNGFRVGLCLHTAVNYLSKVTTTQVASLTQPSNHAITLNTSVVIIHRQSSLMVVMNNLLFLPRSDLAPPLRTFSLQVCSKVYHKETKESCGSPPVKTA